MLVKETVAVRQFTVQKEDLNYVGILFGGKLLAEVDEALAQSTYKFTPNKTVTGSIDKFRFIKPLHLDETVTIKSVVSGYTDRVIEVLGQVYNSENELAAYAVLSFIVLKKGTKLPELVPETDFEKQLLSGYEKRSHNANELHHLIQDSLDIENN